MFVLTENTVDRLNRFGIHTIACIYHSNGLIINTYWFILNNGWKVLVAWCRVVCLKDEFKNEKKPALIISKFGSVQCFMTFHGFHGFSAHRLWCWVVLLLLRNGCRHVDNLDSFLLLGRALLSAWKWWFQLLEGWENWKWVLKMENLCSLFVCRHIWNTKNKNSLTEKEPWLYRAGCANLFSKSEISALATATSAKIKRSF